jgi:P-type conjugative transfer protein TrbJ
MNAIRRLAAVRVFAVLISFAAPPSLAQVVVFDPNNYAQNVLTAARALQQINNQITSLQNEAQMLINQTRNLANLPYSSLQQLQSSIQRTQQLLNQAQRIAYDAADRPCVLDDLRPGLRRNNKSGADIKCTGTLADLGRGIAGCAAGTGRRGPQSRHQP